MVTGTIKYRINIKHCRLQMKQVFKLVIRTHKIISIIRVGPTLTIRKLIPGTDLVQTDKSGLL